MPEIRENGDDDARAWVRRDDRGAAGCRAEMKVHAPQVQLARGHPAQPVPGKWGQTRLDVGEQSDRIPAQYLARSSAQVCRHDDTCEARYVLRGREEPA